MICKQTQTVSIYNVLIIEQLFHRCLLGERTLWFVNKHKPCHFTLPSLLKNLSIIL